MEDASLVRKGDIFFSNVGHLQTLTGVTIPGNAAVA